MIDAPSRPANTDSAAVRSRRSHLGLALTVIALAQLMIVLDVTIVNVSLPHVQRALGFSGNSLEWVVNAYALTFGGLLLLGGRLGDLLGRRSVFIAGVLLFAGASLAGGFATSEAWLIATRVLQGAGAAVIAPTALALLTATFAEGASRNKAMGVYAATSAAGNSVGLLLGGVLVTYVSWRWVFFVNVPIGVLLALLAPRVFAASKRMAGRFDLPGAVTGPTGLALLVYGISHAATDSGGVSRWGDATTMSAVAAAAVLLVAFVLIEWRSSHPLMPLRIFADRNRCGAYLIVLAVVTAMFGIFYFLTIFMQTVWGYSALRSGAAYLPMALTVVLVATLSSRLVARLGARPLLLAGAVLVAAGMFWLSRLTAQGSYLGEVLGPMLVLATGLGLTFPANNVTALAGTEDSDAGLAASLLNISQQIGGSIGLAVLGTVAWSAVATSLRQQAMAAAHAAARAGQSFAQGSANELALQMRDHALQVGFTRGFEVAAGVAALAIVVVLVVIRPRQTSALAESGNKVEKAAVVEIKSGQTGV
jgi:EmrB/QacA subfamily drug resistance transporter